MEHHEGHYILCGLGKIGTRVLEHLCAAGSHVVVVNTTAPRSDAQATPAAVVVGDCRDAATLERAGLSRARGVLILTSDDLTNLSAVLMVRQLHPTVRVVVRLFNQNLITRLGSAVDNVYALSTSALAGPLLALIARTGAALGSFDLDEGHRAQVADLTVAAGSELIGRDLAELAREHEAAVLAHRPVGAGLRLLREAGGSAALAAGDLVVVCGNPRRLGSLLGQGGHESLPVRWAGLIRRHVRVLFRGLAMVDTPVKVCSAVLLGVIASSVIVFHFGMEQNNFADAVYRTISLMATGADMHGEEFAPGAWQKLFISGLRLVGTVLTAAFTAILTNYLVRANLGGVLEIRRIPDGGHVIVCGLGNVGFRTVEELHRQGEPVVVIERTTDNAFIPTVRRLGVPVIIGNATVAEVLARAGAANARAVVAASSNDLVNLEIALLVRELAPQQRVVVRLADAKLAQTLRRSANVRLAISVPDLTAPAFVGRLFGDHIRGLFFVEGQLLIACELQVPARDAFLCGQTINAVTAEFHLVPVGLRSGEGLARLPTGDTTLAPGDRLTVIVTQRELQRLLQRAPAAQRSETPCA